MFQRRQRRFRRRPNGRSHTAHSHTVHSNGNAQSRLRSNSFSNDQKRNNFRSPQSAEKLFEKYTTLAKEAISFGDKTLSENYFQHADHFMRIIEDKNKNKVQVDNKAVISDTNLVKSGSANQDKTTEEKKE